MKLLRRSRLLVTAALIGSTVVTAAVSSSPVLAAEFAPLASPQRIADTRPDGTTVDGMFQKSGPVAAGGVLELPVAGRAGLDADASAAVLNVTTANAAGRGFITVYPCDAARPTAANLNYEPNQIIANAVVAKLDSTGKTCIFTSAAANIIVDATGGLPTGTFDALAAPQRIMDTRPAGDTVDDQFQATGPQVASGTTPLQVTGRAGVAAGAGTAVLNVTVTNPEARGFITLHPCDQPLPLAANLNYDQGQIIANSVVAKLDASGKTCVFTNSKTNIIVDVTGTLPDTTFTPLAAPARIVDTRTNGTTTDGVVQATGFRRAGTTLQFPVAGRAALPDDVSAVVLNVTTAGAESRGFMTLHPRNSARPNAANLNYDKGQIIANTVVAKVGGGGQICLFSSGAADVIVDVTGYLVGPAPVDSTEPCPNEFAAGVQYPVGPYQMPVGRYATDIRPDGGFFCTAERRSGTDFRDFIAQNTVIPGRLMIDVKAGDAYLDYGDSPGTCLPLRPYRKPDPIPTLPAIGTPGFNVVGVHVAPGTYTANVGVGEICTAYRLRDFSGFIGGFQDAPQSIEKVERNSPGPVSITIRAGDVGAVFFVCDWRIT